MSNIELLFTHNKNEIKHVNLYIFMNSFKKERAVWEFLPKSPHRTLFSFVYIFYLGSQIHGSCMPRLQ